MVLWIEMQRSSQTTKCGRNL